MRDSLAMLSLTWPRPERHNLKIDARGSNRFLTRRAGGGGGSVPVRACLHLAGIAQTTHENKTLLSFLPLYLPVRTPRRNLNHEPVLRGQSGVHRPLHESKVVGCVGNPRGHSGVLACHGNRDLRKRMVRSHFRRVLGRQVLGGAEEADVWAGTGAVHPRLCFRFARVSAPAWRVLWEARPFYEEDPP